MSDSLNGMEQPETSGPFGGVGETLLGQVKLLNECTPEQLVAIDCIRLKCTRSENAWRVAHGCVLELGSDFFAEHVFRARLWRQFRPGEYEINTLHLDVCEEVIDLLLTYLYTGKPAPITAKYAVQVWIAAKRYGLRQLEDQTKTFFQQNTERCCREGAIFWHRPTFLADMDFLVELFKDVRLDEGAKRRLLQRPENVCAHKVKKSEELVSRDAPSLCSVSTRGETRLRSEARDHTSVAILGQPIVEQGYIVLSTTLMCVILRGSDSRKSIAPNENSVIFNGRIYIPAGSEVHVRDLKSNRLVKHIDDFTNDYIAGACVHRGEVFFFTRGHIYRVNSQGLNCTRVADVDGEDLQCGFAILRRDSVKITIAVCNAARSHLRKLTFTGGCTMASSSQTLTCPEDMVLIGSHEGLLYFLSNRAPFYYSAVRDAEEVNRHPVANCNDQTKAYIYNQFLCLEGNDHASVIDLNSNAVVFSKSCVEMFLEAPCRMIPIVEKESRKKRSK